MITTIPDRERDLQAQVDALTAELARLRAALHTIASWHEGDVVTGAFDEPHAAMAARAVLAAPPAQPEDESLEFVMLQQLCDRMADLLTRTAAALKGPPEPLTLHDWADLPDVAADVAAVARLKPYSDPPLPAQPADLIEMSPEFTDTARSALLWVLWHHQGGSSDVGQPIRFALGMGQHEHLSDHQIQEAKRWGALPQTVAAQPAEPVQRLSDERAAFEAWHNEYRTQELVRRDDTYYNTHVRCRWEGWQARAIESALQPGWRDIESAPKDGTEVALHEAGRVFRGCWIGIPFVEKRNTDGEYIDQQDAEAYWMDIETGDSTEPTEWQARPLPLPPKTTK